MHARGGARSARAGLRIATPSVSFASTDAMELFRSETMQLVQMIIPAEAAHATVTALGEIGLVQFRDLNPDRSAFQRTYANQVKRCDEMLRKMRFFAEQTHKAGLVAVPRADLDERPYHLDELEAKLDELEHELRQITTNAEKLRASLSELIELQLVLEKAGGFFEGSVALGQSRASRTDSSRLQISGGAGLLGGASRRDRSSAAEAGESLLAGADDSRGFSESDSFQDDQRDPHAVRLGFIAGVVATRKAASFERVLFRSTRGNVFLKQSVIEGKVQDPRTGERVEKTVVVIFFAGERARGKILKICEAFGANRYPFPEDLSRQRQMNAEVTRRLMELQSTLEASTRHGDGVLTAIGRKYDAWLRAIRTEKAAYHALNMFSVDVTRKCLVAEGWCPVSAKPRVREALLLANRNSSAQMGTVFQPIPNTSKNEPPPTYYPVNKVTKVFQGIVESYGVARYREANPAVFTIVTFPFLFAVMFGDFGHGILMLLSALYMVAKEKTLETQKLNEIIQMGFDGRYVILLMSLFSIYTGLLYNECFSVPMNLFGGSKFACDPTDPTRDSTCDSKFATGLVPSGPAPYAMGVDPIWHGSKTELPFLNSLKMKMSILMGVTQMSLGIFMSLLNFLHQKDYLSIWCEFVPQDVFLGSLFGYLSLLIVLKWVTPGATADLYHVMIYMFLSPGNADCRGEGEGGGPGCPENILFPGQAGFQVLLVLLALGSVPVMLFPKPYFLKKRHERRNGRGGAYAVLGGDDSNSVAGGLDDDDREGSGGAPSSDFDHGDAVVHQLIHTIEFVLGAVSNTASYLRLWALSLAHAQLSAVFWDRVFMLAVRSGSPAAMVVGFAVWASATVAVLMLMESLSAFLHALRLHWVEYQNKFYRGDGYAFAPFSFAEILRLEFE